MTKYYLNLEKRHYVSKQTFKLIDKNGQEITETKEMIKETRKFNEQLSKKGKQSTLLTLKT